MGFLSKWFGTAEVPTISPAEAKKRMATAIVLDVREPDEYADGHLPKARLLPLGTINEASAAQAIPTKDSDVLVYCRSGARSRRAVQRLIGLGYTRAVNIGGIMDWPYETER